MVKKSFLFWVQGENEHLIMVPNNIQRTPLDLDQRQLVFIYFIFYFLLRFEGDVL